jgi:exopolysaccharide production protein ExoQ
MAPRLALLAGYICIFWLIARDVKRRPGLSKALWIPLLWVVILGSRPVSLWSGGAGEAIANVEDGSPLDRLVFQLLMAAGIVVLFKRRIGLSRVISENKWLCLYFLYLGISALWSDYPFVSFKRWIKDLGNVVMVLVILSEAEPVNAVKAVFLRCGYILIPLSVIFIKYFPDIGRNYNRWSWQPTFCGVTTNKNLLGITLLVCGLFVVWTFLDEKKEKQKSRVELFAQLVVIGLTAWLFAKADSATSLGCTILGLAIICGMRISAVADRVKRLGVYNLVILVMLMLGNSMFNFEAASVGALGRNTTLTGRTDIWKRVLNENTDPIIGVGYYSFWLGDRGDRVSKGFYFHLLEAHDGYLEVYLDTGWLGLFFLGLMVVFAVGRIWQEVLLGDDWGVVRLAFLIINLIYNVTESAFSRMDLIWFMLLLVIMKCPRGIQAVSSRESGVTEGEVVAAAETLEIPNPVSACPA